MIDIQHLKSQIDHNMIIELMESMGVPLHKADESQLIFYSACHWHEDCRKHKPKLYVYPDNSCHCFSCGFHGDIISLVSQVKSCEFIDAIKYICSILKLSVKDVKELDDVDPWQKELKRWLPDYEPETKEIPIYDKSVLSLFDPWYHSTWLEDGISKETMDKFNIGWYGRNAQISIPVFDMDGNLVGIHARNTRQAVVDKGLKYQPLKTLHTEYKFPTGNVFYGIYQNIENIQNSKSVILFEAPKSVLQYESISDANNSLALFGWNCNKARRDMLVELGVNEVTVALDKQYPNTKSPEFDIYIKQVKKIINLFKPYCQVNVIWDKEDLLSYKDSPTDKGKEVFDTLYEKRTIM